MCPVKGCEKKIVDLIRHLTQVHDWEKDEAKVARGRFGLRKQRAIKEGGIKKNYTKRICPISTCQAVVQRLRNHLSQTHRIKDRENLNMMLSASKIFKETVLFGPEEPSANLKDTLGKESILKNQ